ncbi:PREDICTED: uncharacterized protein LOC100633527 [Amphimedon queenslandica]|nr:PREDICTED: uncharacterized protein LOC100633527 [Amphimedon queenslandica]|eukprot:XP_003389960.1 PREDICTED: uncharacterized protein LOC100633527 [Amphimedon queenslandica]
MVEDSKIKDFYQKLKVVLHAPTSETKNEQLQFQLFDISNSLDLLTTTSEPNLLESLQCIPPYINLEDLLEPIYITSDPATNNLPLKLKDISPATQITRLNPPKELKKDIVPHAKEQLTLLPGPSHSKDPLVVHTDDDRDDSKEICTKKRKLIDGSNSSSDNDMDIMTYVGMTEKHEIRVIEETPEQVKKDDSTDLSPVGVEDIEMIIDESMLEDWPLSDGDDDVIVID